MNHFRTDRKTKSLRSCSHSCFKADALHRLDDQVVISDTRRRGKKCRRSSSAMINI